MPLRKDEKRKKPLTNPKKDKKQNNQAGKNKTLHSDDDDDSKTGEPATNIPKSEENQAEEKDCGDQNESDQELGEITEDKDDEDDEDFKKLSDLKMAKDNESFPYPVIVKVFDYSEISEGVHKSGSQFQKMDLIVADDTCYALLEMQVKSVIQSMFKGKILIISNVKWYNTKQKIVAYENSAEIAVLKNPRFKTIARPEIPSLGSIALEQHYRTVLCIADAMQTKDFNATFSIEGRIVKTFPVEQKTLNDGSVVKLRNFLMKDSNSNASVCKVALWRERTMWKLEEGSYIRISNVYVKQMYGGTVKIVNTRVDSEYSLLEWDKMDVTMDVPEEFLRNSVDTKEVVLKMILESSYFYPACPNKQTCTSNSLIAVSGQWKCCNCGSMYDEPDIAQGIILKIRAKMPGEPGLIGLQLFRDSVEKIAVKPLVFSSAMNAERIAEFIRPFPLRVRGVRKSPKKGGNGTYVNYDTFTITSCVL